MLAKEVLTEEWLADVLQDSLEMDWTTTDGARAIMKALERGLVELPQTGGQIAALATTPPTTNDAIPAGWKLVPVEPTDAILHYLASSADPRMTYAAMLSAAPSAPATEAGEEA